MDPKAETRTQTLAGALLAAGFEHRPLVAGEHGQPHAKAITRDGKLVFIGDAKQVWAWLREQTTEATRGGETFNRATAEAHAQAFDRLAGFTKPR